MILTLGEEWACPAESATLVGGKEVSLSWMYDTSFGARVIWNWERPCFEVLFVSP